MYICLVSCGKMADWIGMPFGMVGRMTPVKHELNGVQSPYRKGASRSLSLLGWLLNKKAARVEVNISLAFLYWVGIAIHP